MFGMGHSSSGDAWKFEIDRFLGDIHEEEYDQFLKMILISSNFAHEIPSHYDSSEADVLPPSSSEEEKIDKTRKLPKRIPP